MDLALKTQKLGSAAARKAKAEARDRLAREIEERRLRKLLYGESSDEDDETSEEESQTFSPITDEQSNDNTSASDSESPVISGTLKAPFSFESYFPTLRGLDTKEPTDPMAVHHEEVDDAGHLMPTTPPSSALTTETFVRVADDPTSPSMYTDMSGGEESFSPPTSPVIPIGTPLETAKSVQYLMPMAKPCIISIKQFLPPIRTTSLEAASPTPLSPPPRSAKRSSCARTVSVPESMHTVTSRTGESSVLSSSPETTTEGLHRREATSNPDIDEGWDMKRQKRQSIFMRPKSSHGVQIRSSTQIFAPVRRQIKRSLTDNMAEHVDYPRSTSLKDQKELHHRSNTLISEASSDSVGSESQSVLSKQSGDTSSRNSPVAKLSRKKSITNALRSVRSRGRLPSTSTPNSPPPANLSHQQSKTSLMDFYPWPTPPPTSQQNGGKAEDYVERPGSSKSNAPQNKTKLMDYYPWPGAHDHTQAKGKFDSNIEMPATAGLDGLGLRSMESRKGLRHVVLEHELASLSKRH